MRKLFLFSIFLICFESIYSESSSFNYRIGYGFSLYTNEGSKEYVGGALPVDDKESVKAYSSKLILDLNFNKKISLSTTFKSSTSLIPFASEIIEADKLFELMDIGMSIFLWKPRYVRRTYNMDLYSLGSQSLYLDNQLLNYGDEFKVYHIVDQIYFFDALAPFWGDISYEYEDFLTCYFGILKVTKIGKISPDVDVHSEYWGGTLLIEQKNRFLIDLGNGYLDFLNLRTEIGMAFSDDYLEEDSHFNLYFSLYQEIGINLIQEISEQISYNIELRGKISLEPGTFGSNGPNTFSPSPLSVTLNGSIQYSTFKNNKKRIAGPYSIIFND